jgi:cysteine desulfurase family protein (TIGR01976 family)
LSRTRTVREGIGVTAPDLSALRARFPALARTQDGRPVVFADAPGGSQVPDTVIEAVAAYYRNGISNSAGPSVTSHEADATVAAAREAGADLVGADPDQIVFGPNSTTLLLHLSRSFARTLGPGDEVVVTRLDHDANIRPWVLAARDAGATVRWVDLRTDDVTLDLDSFEAALSERTRLVAFTLASNAVGTITPAAELLARAKAAGAIVAVDGVHLAQHRAADFGSLGADVLAVSPYKVFGPHLGMLAVRRELLDAWDPYRLRPTDGYASPLRWETGTPNYEGLAGFIAAVEYLADVGRTYGAPANASRRVAVETAYGAIAGHECALALRFLEGLGRIDAVQLYGIADPARVVERTPTFAVRLDDQAPADTAAALAGRGIFVWDGHYYAVELFERLGLLERGGAVRIGFCHYSTPAEVDRVLNALAELG